MVIEKKFKPLTEKKDEGLKKHTEEEKQEYLEKAGKTTLIREGVKGIKRIQQHLDAIFLLLSLGLCLWCGVKFGKKDWLDAFVLLFLTCFSALVVYVAPNSQFSNQIQDKVSEIKKTILGK